MTRVGGSWRPLENRHEASFDGFASFYLVAFVLNIAVNGPTAFCAFDPAFKRHRHLNGSQIEILHPKSQLAEVGTLPVCATPRPEALSDLLRV